MAANSYDFFKIIFGQNPANEEFGFPERFVRLYGHTLSDEVILRPQCGSEWRVQVLKRNGQMSLHKGWPEFVKHFSIRLGHLIFFRYKGNSVFKVSICDLSTCQIYYPDQLGSTMKLKVDDFSKITTIDLTSEEVSSPPRKRVKATLGKSDAEKARKDESPIERGRKMKGQRNEQAKERESDYGRRKPVFITLIKQSMIFSRYNFQLPAKFWRKHLNSITGTVLLHVHGKGTWPVEIMIRRVGRERPSFKRLDWEHFVEGNKLKFADLCTFELLKNGNEVSFNVSIRRSDFASCSQPSQDKNIGQKRQRKNRPKTIASDEAFKFYSTNPFFRTVVRGNQNYAVHVPTAFGKKYFGKSQVLTLAVGTESWKVALISCSSGYNICRGFHIFRKQNSLNPGDVCVYELVERNKAVLKVWIFRNP